MVKNQIHLSEEQLRNIIAENVKKALSEDFGAGMRAVGSRLKNDVGGMFGKPSFGREYYGGSYKNTFKDASMESDYWKLGKELESGIVKDNPIVILDKVKKFAEYGVISQESCKKILGLIKRGNYQEAGHELCYGTMSFGAGEDEVGPTDYEKRHSIHQLEESKLKEIVAESVKRVLKENKEISKPNIKILGDGVYEGALWGHTFLYKGKKYHTEEGWMNIFPAYCKATVKGDDVSLQQVDNYQRRSLIKDFD